MPIRPPGPPRRGRARRASAPSAARSAFETLEARRLLCSEHLIDSMGISLLATAAPVAAPATGAAAPAASTESAASVEVRPTASSTSATATATASAAPGLAANGLPLLHSLPGARVAVFLDFGGFGAAGPYDTDGVPDTFSAAERSAILVAWRHGGAYFSMFGRGVTTQRAPAAAPLSPPPLSNNARGG